MAARIRQEEDGVSRTLQRWWLRPLVVGAIAAMVFGACSTAASPGASSAPTAGGQTGGAQAPADSPTVKKVKAAGKLVGGIGQVLPWTGLDTTTNKYFGATVLIAEEIAKRIGVPLELKPVGNDIVVQEVGAGNIDLALYPLYVNPKRLEVIDMVPWHQGGFCYMVLKDNAKINKLEDLNQDGVRLQAFEGFPFYEEFKKKYPKLTLVYRPPVGDADSGIPDVLAGRADVATIDNPLIYAFLGQYPQFKAVPDAATCLNSPDLPTPIALGSPKGDTAFTAFLTALYAEMAPTIKAELEKYSDPKYIVVPGS
jgi:polar amino acid transport system substrate-binding protein